MSEVVDPSQAGGLAIMQAFVTGQIPPPPMGVLMNLIFTEAEPGSVTGSATPDERHLNPMGQVHGGYAATLLDSALGCAVLTVLGPGDIYATTDLTVKMMRALQPGQGVAVVGRVLNAGRRLVVAEASMTRDDGKLIAHATASHIVTRADA